MDYDLTYADTVEEGSRLVEALCGLADKHGILHLGFDTEFYNVRIGKQSTVARAEVHFASLAWDPGGARLHPRGYPVPVAAVVSRAVAKSPEFKRLLEDPRIVCLGHNLPVDAHTMGNAGVTLHGINTLTLARWCWPGRARAQYGGGGFALDALAKDVLGEGKTESYSELFREVREEWSEKVTTFRRCACGTPGCRKRSDGHHKLTEHETIRTPKYVEVEVPLQDVVPGHPLFERAVKYAAQDAVLSFALWHIITRVMSKQERDVPWLPVPRNLS